VNIILSHGLEIFLLACALDILLGEPPAAIHPVVLIGRLIAALKSRAPRRKAWGVLVAGIVIATAVLAGHILVWAMSQIMPALGVLAGAYLLKSTFAVRCLLFTSRSIGQAIESDITSARRMLPALVGRKTEGLDKVLARSAVIESLFENYVDSVLSPILYFVAFEPLGLGLEAALAFKAISTMDSMLGYKTPELKELGFAGARLDDLANYIPARLSVPILALANPSRGVEAIKAAFRYHSATPSPNSGWPMAAAAGSLGVRLEKPGYYILFEEGLSPGEHDVTRSLFLAGAAIVLTLVSAAYKLAFL
jgi:adenosylcobinamide-phosphate synthase